MGVVEKLVSMGWHGIFVRIPLSSLISGWETEKELQTLKNQAGGGYLSVAMTHLVKKRKVTQEDLWAIGLYGSELLPSFKREEWVIPGIKCYHLRGHTAALVVHDFIPRFLKTYSERLSELYRLLVGPREDEWVRLNIGNVSEKQLEIDFERGPSAGFLSPKELAEFVENLVTVDENGFHDFLQGSEMKLDSTPCAEGLTSDPSETWEDILPQLRWAVCEKRLLSILLSMAYDALPVHMNDRMKENLGNYVRFNPESLLVHVST